MAFSYKDFSELPAASKLTELAQVPFDLTSPDALSPERIENYVCKACGFTLLYATERVDDAVLAALQELADEAGLIEQFMAMKKGAVINRIAGFACENRQVLHTASRDIFSRVPYAPEAAAKAKNELKKLRLFLNALAQGQLVSSAGEAFTTLVQVGIGGSDLGPRALAMALQAYALPGRATHFIANVDPDDAAAVLQKIDLSRSLFVVVSKSGATLETLANEELIRAALAKAGLEAKKHMLVVTAKGSPLDDPDRYLAPFYMEDYIGGRYSVTSMAGAVSLAFLLGFDAFMQVLRGAWDMDMAAEQPDIKKNPALLAALLGIWNRNFLGCNTCAILPYSQALSRFPAHLQQCDMESNGKSVTRSGNLVSWQTGPVIWGEPGTNGQHAFYQLLHQGTEIIPAEFIGFLKGQRGIDLIVSQTTSQEKLLANMLAQSLALAQGKAEKNPARRFAGNRPSFLLLAEQLTPYQMGALLALYEHRIVFQGFCWNINSFDQEGVQLGKVLAARFLRILAHHDTEKQLPSPVERALLEQMGVLGNSLKK